MKLQVLVALIISCTVLQISSVSATNFFETNIVGNTIATEQISAIRLTAYRWKSNSVRVQHSQTSFIVAKTKQEILSRYAANEISDYQLADITRELGGLVFSMNNYFANMQSWEKTGRKEFKNLAMQNLTDSKSAYEQLKATTRASARR